MDAGALNRALPYASFPNTPGPPLDLNDYCLHQASASGWDAGQNSGFSVFQFSSFPAVKSELPAGGFCSAFLGNPHFCRPFRAPVKNLS